MRLRGSGARRNKPASLIWPTTAAHAISCSSHHVGKFNVCVIKAAKCSVLFCYLYSLHGPVSQKHSGFRFKLLRPPATCSTRTEPSLPLGRLFFACCVLACWRARALVCLLTARVLKAGAPQSEAPVGAAVPLQGNIRPY